MFFPSESKCFESRILEFFTNRNQRSLYTKVLIFACLPPATLALCTFFSSFYFFNSREVSRRWYPSPRSVWWLGECQENYQGPSIPDIIRIGIEKLDNSLPENTIVDQQLPPLLTSGRKNLLIQKTRVISQAGLSMSIIERTRVRIRAPPLSTGLRRYYALSWCTRACRDFYPPWLDVNNWDSVLTSKSWSLRYHFRARLRLPPICLLQRYQSLNRLPMGYIWQIFFPQTFKVTCIDLAMTFSMKGLLLLL